MGNRTLILVRHGQYHLDETHARYGRLTTLGQRQARRFAKRVAQYSFDAVHVSTAPRALETAEIILERFPKLAPKRSRLLLEGLPGAFEGITRAQRKKIPGDRARMERAFKRYFRPTHGPDRLELVVCHGNIIRYLLRRATDDSVDKWWRAAIMHCGLSIVVMREVGVPRIYALNDVGHLPHAMQTFS